MGWFKTPERQREESRMDVPGLYNALYGKKGRDLGEEELPVLPVEVDNSSAVTSSRLKAIDLINQAYTDGVLDGFSVPLGWGNGGQVETVNMAQTVPLLIGRKDNHNLLGIIEAGLDFVEPGVERRILGGDILSWVNGTFPWWSDDNENMVMRMSEEGDGRRTGRRIFLKNQLLVAENIFEVQRNNFDHRLNLDWLMREGGVNGIFTILTAPSDEGLLNLGLGSCRLGELIDSGIVLPLYRRAISRLGIEYETADGCRITVPSVV